MELKIDNGIEKFHYLFLSQSSFTQFKFLNFQLLFVVNLRNGADEEHIFVFPDKDYKPEE